MKKKNIHLENNINHRTFYSCNLEIKDNLKINYPALFLDRDGVLIKDCHYIKEPIDVEILEGVRVLMKNAFKFGFKVIVVTNQSGISRGFLSWKDYEKVNQKMNDLLGDENFIEAIYANSCSPDSSDHNWRKPNPMMIYEAKKDLNINIDKSIIIGDRLTDLKAGYKAGVKLLVHVLTGYGEQEREQILQFFELPRKIYKSKLTSRFKLNNSYQEILLINNLTEFKENFFKFS